MKRRIIARIIDFIGISCFSPLLVLLQRETLNGFQLFLFASLVAFCYEAGSLLLFGRTLGKRIMKLSIVFPSEKTVLFKLMRAFTFAFFFAPPNPLTVILAVYSGFLMTYSGKTILDSVALTSVEKTPKLK